ncbi:peptidyl serine alpha-galactosyltransferase [Rhynchospora pubera]|uniref:Peptidyl serine alpha-galactosyltransferase n=1 Tax=Rhynchospora pubera TaxID=906938 RepID=A0AAV8CTM6_9POAL|nr:peptidyl serine alpha-galactosyltransferase [Rhynchospora pubera]
MRALIPTFFFFFLLHLLLSPLTTTAQEGGSQSEDKLPWRMHTLFSVECQDYFDWQTVGLMHSLQKANHPGPVTRLLSCTEDELRRYRGMNLAPTMVVPSMSRHPHTGDWYPAINKPAGVVHWLENSQDADNVDWVVILDADMIVRGPLIPWELGAEKGKPVAAYYGYLKGCDNILAKLHTTHPEWCDKVGGILAMHINDLRALAPLWLSKTEEVRDDRAHWSTNITGDIYGMGWISEMYGYSFGAAEVGLHHKINDDIMIYPGYIPRPTVEPVLMHYGLPFKVGNWSFSKLEHHEDGVVYDCNRLFPPPPFPREVEMLEPDPNIRRSLFISIECINTLNEGLHLHHLSAGCPRPRWSKYLSFLKSNRFKELTKPKYLNQPASYTTIINKNRIVGELQGRKPKIHTLFSTECSTYFDWQTVGFMHSFRLSGQPGGVTRLLSCTDEDLKMYKGRDLAPTHYVPSMTQHPLTGDLYPAINKPAAVLHWLNHVKADAEYVVILDADMIMRGPITPWEYGARPGHPVSAPYEYLIGCDNVLAEIHTRNPSFCEKVGGVIIMHIDDLKRFAMLWFHKSLEVRADKEHYATNITGDIYASGWISEMYGYSFAAAELKLRHIIRRDIMLYPGYVPESASSIRVFHYGLRFSVGNWSFDKADWRYIDMVNTCWAKFPDPPEASSITTRDPDERARDLLSIECAKTLNTALDLHHQRRRCPTEDVTEEKKLGDKVQVDTVLSDLNSSTGGDSPGERRLEDNLQVDTMLSDINFSLNTSSDFHRPEAGTRSNMRWMVALWGIFVFLFCATFVVLSGRKRAGLKPRSFRNKKR